MSGTQESSGAVRSRAGVATLILFAVAMGWLEGVVVVYIRALLGFAAGAAYPEEPELLDRMRSLAWLVPIEQTREVATLVMLASLAWLAAERARPRLGSFLVLFGVWDITYYVAMFALLRWPTTITTMDLLFLLPPGRWWYQPVWVPIAISLFMIALGLGLLRRR